MPWKIVTWVTLTMNILQAQRKEAIYRQMLEYRRSYEQEAKRANEIEAQKRALEASVQAVEFCWTQVSLHLNEVMRFSCRK